MLTRFLTTLSTLLAVSTIAVPAAFSQCAYPVNPNTTDPVVARQIVGTWYSEIKNSQLGMVQQIYQTFLNTGVFEYQDRTCTSVSCSQNYGHGYWAGRRQANSIYLRVQFSDLNRTNQCTGVAVRFKNSNTMVSANGNVYHRVR
jgi:hypothetical protein